ncbi:MAG TPA: hypothetical protein VKU02_13845 [Gemmataceae bacterium]|nr:hypothetical protein [Gemmataceae bacterium]
MPEQFTPSIEHVKSIADAAANLVRVIQSEYCLADQRYPTGRAAGDRIYPTIEAIQFLERAFNPERLSLNDPRHNSISCSGWPREVFDGVFRGLRAIRAILNDLIQAWKLEPLCDSDEDGFVVFPEGCVLNGSPLPKTRIEVPASWPPEIERHVWEALGINTERLAQAIRFVSSPSGDGRDDDEWSVQTIHETKKSTPESQKQASDIPTGNLSLQKFFLTAAEIAQIYGQSTQVVGTYLCRLVEKDSRYRIPNPEYKKSRDPQFLYVAALVLPKCDKKWSRVPPHQVSS